EGLDEILDGARRRAGLDHATCHQLRHTCLTRLREAGMALEAVQAQAGHLSIESTRVYLHLTNEWLAQEYRRAAALIDADTAAVEAMLAVQQAAVSAKIGALYGQQPELAADYETTGMARLRRETHARMLGSSVCTRPVDWTAAWNR